MDFNIKKQELQGNFDKTNTLIEERKELIKNTQNEINELMVEVYRLQGEYRLVERMEQEDKPKEEKPNIKNKEK